MSEAKQWSPDLEGKAPEPGKWVSAAHAALEKEMVAGKVTTDNINDRGREGMTRLYVAAAMGDEELTSKLLQNGADRTIGKKDDVTGKELNFLPLHAAAFIQNQNIIIQLTANPPPSEEYINTRDSNGRTPMHMAYMGDVLAPGNPNSSHAKGALSYAGADMSVTDNNGETAKQLAARTKTEAGNKPVPANPTNLLFSLPDKDLMKLAISPEARAALSEQTGIAVQNPLAGESDHPSGLPPKRGGSQGR